MVGNDIVGIRQMSLLVVVHLLSRCRPSGHQGKNENYGVSDSSQQGYKWKLWCFMLFLCTSIIFARVQQSDRWSYLKFEEARGWVILNNARGQKWAIIEVPRGH